MPKYVKCTYCSGRGMVIMWNPKKKVHEEVTCPICHGKGGVHV